MHEKTKKRSFVVTKGKTFEKPVFLANNISFLPKILITL